MRPVAHTAGVIVLFLVVIGMTVYQRVDPRDISRSSSSTSGGGAIGSAPPVDSASAGLGIVEVQQPHRAKGLPPVALPQQQLEQHQQKDSTSSARGPAVATSGLSPPLPMYQASNVAELAALHAEEERDCGLRPQPNTYVKNNAGEAGSVTHLYSYNDMEREGVVDKTWWDRTPGIYNDYGYKSPLYDNDTDLVNLPPGQYLHGCPSVPMGALLMDEIKSGYGLTNQLLSFAGLLALSVRTRRFAFIPSGRVPILFYLDLDKSVLPPGVLLTTHTDCKIRKRAVPFRSLIKSLFHRKGTNYQEVDRKQIAVRPHKAMHRLDAIIVMASTVPAYYVHEMYLRYPYEQENNNRTWVAPILCGLRFHVVVELAHQKVMRDVKEKYPDVAVRGYAAVHLRLETSDNKAILRGRALSTAKHLREFFLETVFPLARKQGVAAIFICSGPLSREHEAVLESLSTPQLPIVDKTDYLNNTQVGSQLSDVNTVQFHDWSGAYSPTSTRGAAVDLMILEGAKFALVTTFSSFSLSVYSKRCIGEAFGCRSVGNVFMYDIYLDGSFTKEILYPCGLEFGQYHRAPPALLHRPPKRLRVVTFRTNPDSPLFANKTRKLG